MSSLKSYLSNKPKHCTLTFLNFYNYICSNAFVFFLYIFEQVGDNLPFEIFPNDANYNARGLYARFDQYEIGATVVANDHGGSGPREVSATNSDFVSDSGTFKATYRPLIAGTYDLFIKLIEDSSLAPVSI